MNKELIQKRFAKNLDTYNDNAKIQKIMADRLISFLKTKNFNSIWEIGCGTGFLTNLAVKNLNFCSYTANDIVKECEDYIKTINPNIKFLCNDIERFINEDQEKYDLIISNAAFQWVENFEEFINKLISKLNPEGILLFSTFGKENFREIYHVIGESLNYYSTLELKTFFKELNPIIEEEIRIMAFKTPIDILKHIKNTGVNSIEAHSWTKTDMQRFENGYNNFCAKHPTLTYNPIYVLIKKP